MALALTSVSDFVALRFLPNQETAWAEILEMVIVSLSWFLNFLYATITLKEGNVSHRGAKSVIFCYTICLIVDLVTARSDLFQEDPNASTECLIIFIGAVAQFTCHLLYVTTFLVPSSGSGDYITFEDEEEVNISRIYRAGHLGVAKEFTPFLSKLFIYWVNPLIAKGRRGKLHTPDDLFGLPYDMDTFILGQEFQMAKSSVQNNSQDRVPLLKILLKLFTKPFVLGGILKFLADLAGFASPLLLNRIVSFMESKDDNISWGYLYAFGLAASSFVVALCNTHFNLLMSELGLKVRASVISAVYTHTLSISNAEMSKFNLGEVINFMSTDTDRVVNFSPSVHAAWSLPFQFFITLGLLYQQVGVSSLTGVALTILMIPLNKLIADKIGKMSTSMMTEKDKRVSLMSEVLAGIRVIKFFTWETYFNTRVTKVRKEELKYLKGRKYLDAICVYLWATTPVIISVLTFSLYSLLGNELTAAKVFTSVALFAMLTGPLNAFPWVLNGLVEAMVSIKRIGTFLALKSINRSDYFNEGLDPEDERHIILSNTRFSNNANGNDIDVQQFKLSNVSLDIKEGEFLGVIGKVGSGKSTLLKALIGEVNKEEGDIQVVDPPRGVAYVQQEPWLQQGTIRENILFGRDFDQEYYDKVVDACALKLDIAEVTN
jgi:ATP-binding cassette subfamily C (CFTR/MRP) protein 10